MHNAGGKKKMNPLSYWLVEPSLVLVVVKWCLMTPGCHEAPFYYNKEEAGRVVGMCAARSQ